MTQHSARTRVIAAALLVCVGGDALAQGPPVLPSRPESDGMSKCLLSSSAVRAATGGILGGWLGFVAAKIKMSDWNDASHSASGTRTRNQFTIGGALIGAIGASLIHVNKNCYSSTATSQPRGPRAPITAEEIARAGVNGSVYDVVYTLRRTWLNMRGMNSGSEGVHSVLTTADTMALAGGEPQLIVYLDNVKLGTVSELQRLTIVGVTSIRYYDPAEANYLWGTGHTHGAIQVVTVDRQQQFK
jgi:hypothetical protein